jgi:two-component system, chemotaxis family, sensor histidine kinase and response regulator PixL
MDNDQQIPLKFLDEAEDCCDRIESTVLGLANTIPHPPELDNALRATHSIKGGAAMMGFNPLSCVAHQLEDFLKVIRVRYHSQSIGIDVETLLLEAVDDLRLVINLHRRGQVIDQTWLDNNSQPTFDQLRQHLGDLRIEDEDVLFSQEGETDPAILFFESGVKESLDDLEEKLNRLAPPELLPELTAAAAELSEFGRMAQLEQFVALCQSVQDYSQRVDLAQVLPLTRQALKIWRKAHSLVQLGRFENIPSQLPRWPLTQDPQESLESSNFFYPIPGETAEFSGISFGQEDLFNPSLAGLDELINIGAIDLDLPLLPLDIDDQELPIANNSTFDTDKVSEFLTSHEFDGENLELSLDLEFGNFNIPEFPLPNASEEEEEPAPSLELGSDLAKIEIQNTTDQLIASASASIIPTTIPSTQEFAEATPIDQQTVRVPVEYLQQFNKAFGQLILERNAINLRLAEIQSYTSLLRKRIQKLEASNQQLLQWQEDPPEILSSSLENDGLPTTVLNSLTDFDALEMDHYNDLNLISQDQIETIVQLEEVTSDIEFSVREMTQSLSNLNQTTRTLQTNVVRTQMVPFVEVAKRFPRLIRDLSVQFDKTVHLTILGENTGIDRSILENLSDPLLHLVRNAFDHGIEDVETRIAAGKPAEGSIIIEASQRGGDIIITVTDDGGGINLDRIQQRLQYMGLTTADISEIPESQLLDIIFEPGFSTVERLTELSGRGVGMDIVRTNIRQVRGDIQVKTQPGVGTTFTIRVPFALSILRVMLLERAGFIFAVSVDSVREIIHSQPDLLTTDGTKISWQSQTIPVVSIEQGINFGRSYRPFSLPGAPIISQPTVLIVGEDSLLTAFHIDRFWGEKEVTLRSIDSPMPLTPGFGNSIILGDGRVIPLVDLMQLANWISVHHRAPVATNSDKSIAIDSTAVVPRNSFDSVLSAVAQRPSDTILVIDDSINVRRYLAMMLEKDGYQVEQARDGQEAVDKLDAGLVVQGVLCDIEMPRLDGYGVLDTLRSQEVFADLPILMLSSRSSEKHRQLAMNLGASGYFTKPYTEPELLGTLKSLIAAAQ